MRVDGAALSTMHARADTAAEATVQQVRRVLHQAAQRFHGSVDDLAVIPTLWDQRVDKLTAHVDDAYRAGVNGIRAGLADAIRARRALTADAGTADQVDEEIEGPDPDYPDVVQPEDITLAPVANQVAQQRLATATNRLRSASDDIWHAARAQLLVGMQAGESIPKLSGRIVDSVAFSAARAETVARTEVISASNSGSIDQVRAVGVQASKVWLATGDDRTRPDHADADGQSVDLDGQFDVGGDSLDYPGDPSGSAEQVINCRCTLTYDIPDGQVDDLADSEDGMLASAAFHQRGKHVQAVHGRRAALQQDQTHDGAMIALVPSDADLDRLVFRGGEPRDELHLTLFYLGDAAAITAEQTDKLVNLLQHVTRPAVPGVAFGVNYWNPGSDMPAWVLAVGDPEQDNQLANFHAMIALDVGPGELLDAMPDQHTPWVPHICLAYSQDTTLLDAMIDKCGPVTFDRLRLAVGGETWDVTLS